MNEMTPEYGVWGHGQIALAEGYARLLEAVRECHATDMTGILDPRVHTETLATIFLDWDNPAAGTLAEYSDGSWTVDLPTEPIDRATMRSIAQAVIDVIDHPCGR